MSMKKILSILALAGLIATSCIQEEPIVQFNPEEATAPTLSEVTGATLSAEGQDISIAFGAADFGFTSAKTYQLYISTSEDFAAAEKLSASYAKEALSIQAKTLNSAILNLGGSAEEEFTLYFRLHAYMADNTGNAIASTELVSNVVSGTFVPYDMLVMDKDTYEHVFVIGTYCDWAFDSAKIQHLYNYTKDGKTYTGVIDFNGNAASGFKLTGLPKWDDSCNWGSEAQEEEEEATSIQLISSGGSKDIKAYSKRFYNFSFDKSSLVLTKLAGFDKIGIVGEFNEWGNDVEMSYNPAYVRFFADIELAADSKLKFRADADWALNWGENAEANGADILVPAGNYRAYLDLNKKEIRFDAKMYKQEEPGLIIEEPAPIKPSAWSLIGTIGGSSWDKDFDLANVGGDSWVIRSVALTANDEFKIRADHDWKESYGGPEANDKSTIDPSNPYDVYKPELGTAFEAGGVNIHVGVEGTYDISFDYAAKTILIEEHKASYALIGEINGDSWSKDVVMTQNGDVWTSPVVNITGGFKIRYDYSWDDANVYGAAEGFTPELGKAFTATQPGANITVPEAGDYKVIFNAATKEITINAVAFPETMYMIGEEFGGWNWSDAGIVDMTPVHSGEGQFWAIRYITAGKGFKFCSVKDWKGDFHSLDTNNGYTVDGGNCLVEKDGLYMIHIDLKRSIVNIEPAKVYGFGSCFDGWDAGKEVLFTVEGKTAKSSIKADGEVRMFAGSSIANTDWWTREFVILDGKIAYRGTGDDQQRVNCTAGQTVTLDFNAGTGEIK